MKEFGQLGLTDREVEALARLKQDLSARFPLVDIVVFGSRVRGDSDLESDLDVLVVLSVRRSHKIRAEVSGVVFEINLDLGTNISALVVGSEEWLNGRLSESPIKQNVDKEGVSIWYKAVHRRRSTGGVRPWNVYLLRKASMMRAAWAFA